MLNFLRIISTQQQKEDQNTLKNIDQIPGILDPKDANE